MRVRLREPLDFIHNKDVLEFDVNMGKSLYIISSGTFKQSLKLSEYQQLMNAAIKVDEKLPPAITVPEKKVVESYDENARHDDLKLITKAELKQIAEKYNDYDEHDNKEELISLIISHEKKANAPIK